MLELSDQSFKATMIHMLSALMEIMDDLQEQIGNMCRAGNSKKEPKGKQRNF